MKKYLCLVCAIIVTFMFMGNVNADVEFNPTSNCSDVGNLRTCRITLENVPKYYFNRVELNVYMQEAVTYSKFEANSSWSLTSTTDGSAVTGFPKVKKLIIDYNGTGGYPEAGKVTVGTVTFEIDKINGRECNTIFSLNLIKKCGVSNGIFYDKDGKETDELTYVKQCLKPECKILSDGTFLGTNGVLSKCLSSFIWLSV